MSNLENPRCVRPSNEFPRNRIFESESHSGPVFSQFNYFQRHRCHSVPLGSLVTKLKVTRRGKKLFRSSAYQLSNFPHGNIRASLFPLSSKLHLFPNFVSVRLRVSSEPFRDGFYVRSGPSGPPDEKLKGS